MTIKSEERIVLLDDHYNEIGTAPKLESHHLHTPLHRAFSCYVFNDKGEFLVTQRALSKKVWPGVWTNSLCGHPAPSETFEAAIGRRAREELGMTVKDIEIVLPRYHYTTPPFNGVIENEFCPVFAARLVSGPNPNPAEVEAYVWMSWGAYQAAIMDEPDKYSYWAKDQLRQLKERPIILQYASTQ